MLRALSIAIALVIGLATPALAQHADHGSSSGDDTASTREFKDANARMHAGMDIAYEGDADVDFVRGMIAHHRGAVDMARIVIEHGADPDVRALAEAIIAAQEEEIAWMEDWLARHRP